MDTISPRTAPEVVKEARQLRGLSQAELAERLSVARGAIAEWEAKGAPPSRRDELVAVLGDAVGWVEARDQPGFALSLSEWERVRDEWRISEGMQADAAAVPDDAEFVPDFPPPTSIDGATLRKARALRELSQAELAQLIGGVTPGAVTHWEKTGVPPKRVARVADLLHAQLETLAGVRPAPVFDLTQVPTNALVAELARRSDAGTL